MSIANGALRLRAQFKLPAAREEDVSVGFEN